MRLIWSRIALGDLDRIFEHIAEDDPEAAADVFHTIIRQAEQLERHPRLGHEGTVPGTFELVIPPYRNYIVVYEINADALDILAVMHSRQDWPTAFHRPR